MESSFNSDVPLPLPLPLLLLLPLPLPLLPLPLLIAETGKFFGFEFGSWELIQNFGQKLKVLFKI
jgi:hypothetical protein